MRAVRCALIALTIALPVSAQTPAQLAQVDTLRTELVRTCGFAKGADTQLTKALDADSTADAQRTELVRSRGFIRGSITQCAKTLAILDALLGNVTPTPEPPDTVTPEPPDTVTPEPPDTVTPEPDVVEDFSTYTSTTNMLSDPRGIYLTFEDFRTNRITLDTSIGYGSSDRSMRYDYPSGTGTDYTISRSLPIPGGAQEVWVEAIVRFSPNFSIAGNGQQAGNALKTLHVGVRGVAGRFGLNFEGSSMRAEGPNDDYDDLYISGGPSVSSVMDGQWHILRYHVRLGATDFHEYWVDGMHRGSQTGRTAASSLVAVALAKNLNKLAPNAQSLWWGKVSVWTQNPGW